MEVHVRLKHIDNASIKCTMCVFKTISETEMELHMVNEHEREKLYECDKCTYDSIIKGLFDAHVKSHHAEKSNINYSRCIYWNQGYCRYGFECKFIHEEIPECKFQERCQNFQCPYFHYNKNWNSFLGRSQRDLSKRR